MATFYDILGTTSDYFKIGGKNGITVFTGNTEPTNSFGQPGDIYVQTEIEVEKAVIATYLTKAALLADTTTQFYDGCYVEVTNDESHVPSGNTTIYMRNNSNWIFVYDVTDSEKSYFVRCGKLFLKLSNDTWVESSSMLSDEYLMLNSVSPQIVSTNVTFNGITTAQTQELTDKSNKLATTAYVQNAIINSGNLPSTTLSDAGKILKVNSVGEPYWEFSGSANLNDIGDVNVSSPTNRQLLSFNSTSNNWENVDNLIPPINGQNNKFLFTNGTATMWSNITVTLNGISDVNVSSPSDRQVLAFNQSTNTWVNADVGTIYYWSEGAQL